MAVLVTGGGVPSHPIQVLLAFTLILSLGLSIHVPTWVVLGLVLFPAPAPLGPAALPVVAVVMNSWVFVDSPVVARVLFLSQYDFHLINEIKSSCTYLLTAEAIFRSGSMSIQSHASTTRGKLSILRSESWSTVHKSSEIHFGNY